MQLKQELLPKKQKEKRNSKNIVLKWKKELKLKDLSRKDLELSMKKDKRRKELREKKDLRS